MRAVTFAPLFGLCALWALPALAQSDDRDYLTALLEDYLSSAGRQVVITGFEGALSSQARMQSLTIADDQGVWIALKDIELDWRRADLLAGQITVNRLTAGEITLSRLPQTQGIPTAEAPEFSLPELPVAINIGAIGVDRLQLGAKVLGQEVNASASAALQLAGGEGQATLSLRRNAGDAAQGRASLEIAYSNAARRLKVDLAASEGAGGILAKALGIPNAPDLGLTLAGDAPLSDFAAEFSLRADGVQRFGGRVTWADQGAPGPSMASGFTLDMQGDVAPLFQPQFRPFFGDRAQILARGLRNGDGGFDLSEFSVASAALSLTGSLSIDGSGLPRAFALTGDLRRKDGAPLVLPLALDQPAAISSATLSASFDAAKGDSFRITGQAQNWQQDDLRVAASQFSADGQIQRAPGGARVTANLSFAGEGIQPARRALSQALGTVIWGDGAVEWQNGDLALRNLRLMGEDYAASVSGMIDGLNAGLAFDGEVALWADDLARFSGLLGRPIAGAARLDYRGRYGTLTGGFDGVVTAQTQDLQTGIAALDETLAGRATMMLSAQRGAQGITLRALDIKAAGLRAQMAGSLTAGAIDLAGEFSLPDMAAQARGFGGALAGRIVVAGVPQDAQITLNAQGQNLGLTSPNLTELLRGTVSVDAALRLRDFAPDGVQASLRSDLIMADVNQSQADAPFEIAGELADLGVIVPQFPGRATLSGRASPSGDGAMLDLRAMGPAALDAQIAGRLSAGGDNDLRLTGAVDAALANAFVAPRSLSGGVTYNLRLQGAPDLANLSGSIALAAGRLADPSLPFALQKVDLSLALGGGQAQVTGLANASREGTIRVDGTIATHAPFDSDLTFRLRDLGLSDPDLFQSTVAGKLNLTGPLTGGARLDGILDLGRTEVQLRVPTVVEGARLPDLRHVNDSAAARQTRENAGFTALQSQEGGAAPIALNITLRAPNRLFVRGRGLDAELGGAVVLQGDTGDVRPNGSFDLVQGHFDILTTRLDLQEVRLEMRGRLTPFLFVSATSVKDGIITNATIDGPALDPEFAFTSSPEMPQEDVLAQLLFDQSLQNLSVLETIKLTSAVASLTGRGQGLISRARQRLNLDNLDVQTNEAGETALKLGKYLSKNVYSELSAEGSGQQALDFTYTLNEKIKLKAGAQTNGNASIGLEFETNY